MVEFDETKKPLYTLRVDALKTIPEMQEYLDIIGEILSRKERFVLIIHHYTMDDGAKSPGMLRDNETRQLGQSWMKEHRPQMSEFCAGVGMVSPSTGFLAKFTPMAGMMIRKRMGAPGALFKTEEEAEEWLRKKLN